MNVRRIRCWLVAKRNGLLFQVADIFIYCIVFPLLIAVIVKNWPDTIFLIILLVAIIAFKIVLFVIGRVEGPIEAITNIVNASLGFTELTSISALLRKSEDKLVENDVVHIVTNSIHAFDIKEPVLEVVTENLKKGVEYRYYLLDNKSNIEVIDLYYEKLSNMLDAKVLGGGRDRRGKREAMFKKSLGRLSFSLYGDRNVLCNIALLDTQVYSENNEFGVGFWYTTMKDKPNETAFLTMGGEQIINLRVFFKAMSKCSWPYFIKKKEEL